MELWMRSQDRMTLCKCNNIYIDDEWVDPYYIKNGTLTLGEYSTKERALEILDEIQSILRTEPLVIVGSNEEKIEYKELSTYVYQMPEE